MANNPVENTNAEMSFLEEDSGNGIQIKDILFIILHNLHWFLLCGLIGAGIAYWKVSREERVYASSASIMIKTGASSGTESIRSSSVMNQMLGNDGLVSTINNEIIILKSASLMDSVVRNLGLNVSYSYKTKIAKRNKALYQDSPVAVTFENMDESAYFAFTVTPKDDTHFVLSDMSENAQGKEVALGEKIMTPVGEMVVAEKWNYQSLIGVPIAVNVVPVPAMSASLRRRLNVARDDEKNSILRLSISDNSASRAADVLNTLIAVYNNDAIADQERMLAYSYKFINGRIDQLYADICLYLKGYLTCKKITFIPQLYSRMIIGESNLYAYHNNIGSNIFGRIYDYQLPFIGLNHATDLTDRMKCIHVARLDVRYNFLKKNYITAMVNYGRASDELQNLFIYDNSDYSFGAGLMYSRNSVIGPISFQVHWLNDTDQPWGAYINIGYLFR